MGSRWQLRVPRAEDEREHNPVRGVIHNIHRIKPPSPGPYPAHSRRYRRFTDTLTGIAARLAVNRGLAS